MNGLGISTLPLGRAAFMPGIDSEKRIRLTRSQKAAKASCRTWSDIQKTLKILDFGLHRNDEKLEFASFRGIVDS
jgi:hypothetical protein